MSNTTTDIIRKGLILKTAQTLLKPNNAVTTLEIKTDLRKNHPGYYWDQAFVSQCMNEYSIKGIFNYNDNGTYRTYFDPARPCANTTPTAAPQTIPAKSPKKAKAAKSAKKDKWATSAKISKSKALAMMQNNKGHFFSVQFTKKGDGTLRTMNCQYLPGQTVNLGVVKVKEACLVRSKDANPVRSFDMSTLKKVSIGGQVYSVR